MALADSKKQKKVFITGIAGFIGFHLAQKLAESGVAVEGCDNFNDYYDPHLKQERAKLLQKRGIKVHQLDILDDKLLEKIALSFQSSHFVHLAAQAGVRYSLKSPEKYIDANLVGFSKILEFIRHHSHIKLVYASSSSVYGLSKKIPFSETDSADMPASLYGATKRANEMMAFSYHHLYQISAIGLRFFTVYGPFGRPDMAYYSFTKAILENRPIDVFNFGEVYRDYTYIDDIIQGVISAVNSNVGCDIFNLGNHHPEGVNTLIEIIEDYFNIKAKKNMLPMQAGDVEKTYADISKSAKLLNFVPTTSLKEGMHKFLDWYCDYYKVAKVK